jgi:hypothetical protein
MGIRLIFRNHQSGAEQERRRVGDPVIGFGFKPVGGGRRKKTRPRRREVMAKASGPKSPIPRFREKLRAALMGW